LLDQENHKKYLICIEISTVFEEESITLHHATYNKNSKKLFIEKVNLKNKKISEKWKSEIDFQGVKSLKFMKFHEATSEALKYSIDYIEK
jgi:hypothetical protein